jgi:hypothetical protein
MAVFELLTDRKEIRAAQTMLEAVLDGGLPLRPGTYTVGYPGGRYETSKLRSNNNRDTHYLPQQPQQPGHPLSAENNCAKPGSE